MYIYYNSEIYKYISQPNFTYKESTMTFDIGFLIVVSTLAFLFFSPYFIVRHMAVRGQELYEEARELHMEYLCMRQNRNQTSVLTDERRLHDSDTELVRQMATRKIKKYERYTGDLFRI